jgi:hypothetical protein
MPYSPIIKNLPCLSQTGELQTFDFKEDCREYVRDKMHQALINTIDYVARVEPYEEDYNAASEHLSRYNYAIFLGCYYGVEPSYGVEQSNRISHERK